AGGSVLRRGGRGEADAGRASACQRAGVGAGRCAEGAVLLDGSGGRSAVQRARRRRADDLDESGRPPGDRLVAAAIGGRRVDRTGLSAGDRVGVGRRVRGSAGAGRVAARRRTRSAFGTARCVGRRCVMTANSKAAPTSVSGTNASRDARKMAAVLLEVLAGLRTPVQAAEVLQVSLPRYYQLESRALAGFVAACEARPKGRQPDTVKLETLRRDNERLQRDLTRQQSLVRLTQRTIGVAAPTPVKADTRKRKRKPMVRALRRV